MLEPINLRVDYGSISGDRANKIVASNRPTLSWGGYSGKDNDFQTAYHVVVTCDGEICWDSGVRKSSGSSVKYRGKCLPAGKRVDYSVRIADRDGMFSGFQSDCFYCGAFEELPPAKWICCPEDTEGVPAYFRKEFAVKGPVREAAVFACGIGYSEVTINGSRIDQTCLNPAISDYTKTCYYKVIPEADQYLKQGRNCIGISLADGWRRNPGEYLKIYQHTPAFFGVPCLWAAVRITYENNSEEWILSDESWQWCRGGIVRANLYHGETFDASARIPGWDEAGENHCFSGAKLFEGQLGRLKPMVVEPIGIYEEVKPVSIHRLGEGRFIVDFGKNMAGVLRVRLPKSMRKGQQITLRHSELLYDDGSLNVETLRGAENCDIYLASGDGRDLESYQPRFTYHGFRYAEVSGLPLLHKEDVTALMLCTRLESVSAFTCGNALLPRIAEMVKQSELSTVHSLINDTCGRSERLCWLDDGFVRYEEMAYHFDIGKIFRQVMQAVLDTQEADGSITCTAPHVYGRRPADPMSSAYFFLAREAYLRTGDLDIIRDNYESFTAWNQLLLENSTEYILNYSYYGDWGSPRYSCDPNTMGTGAGSKLTPTNLFGTVMFLASCNTLEEFARLLGKWEDAERFAARADRIREAFLKKWYVRGSGRVHNGDHSCQVLALYFDILPEEDRTKAAKLLRDDLVGNGYRFTTGAITYKLMTDVLVRYGYLEEFYELITKDSYPSLGYMVQCGATTAWEKFEYITGPGMNAHTHCANGGVCASYYQYLAGITPIGGGYSEIDVRPYYPANLHTVSLTLNTVRGDISVAWRRIDGRINLWVNIPFNTKANICLPDGIKTVGSGFHCFVWNE